MDIPGRLGELGVIPVVKIENVEHAAGLADALLAAGLPCAEITFRTSCAEEAIERIVSEKPEMLVGAGTVLSVEQARQAVGAGAKFIVSPGLNLQVVEYCIDHEVAVIPGIATPTEAMLAMGRGLIVLKVFPAEALGGMAYLQAISPALPGAKFIPTGGISAANMIDWLRLGCVHSVAGSWLATAKMLAETRYDEITRLARQAVENVRTARPVVELR